MPLSSQELDSGFNSKLPAQKTDWAKKSHAEYSHLGTFIRSDERVLYVVRHPLDVLQSSLNYMLLNQEIPNTPSARSEWIERYIQNQGNPEWMKPPINAENWNQNVLSWATHEKKLTLVMRYEDMNSDPKENIRKCAEFLGIPVDAEYIERCAAATTFARLKAFEEKEMELAKTLGAPQGRFSQSARLVASNSGARFFNRGKPGSFVEDLSQAQIEKAWSVFGDVAAMLGYDPQP